MTTQRHRKMFRAENRIDVKTIMIEPEEPKETLKDNQMNATYAVS